MGGAAKYSPFLQPAHFTGPTRCFFAFGVKHLSKLRSIPAHSWRCSLQVAAEEFGAYGGHRSSELFFDLATVSLGFYIEKLRAAMMGREETDMAPSSRVFFCPVLASMATCIFEQRASWSLPALMTPQRL